MNALADLHLKNGEFFMSCIIVRIDEIGVEGRGSKESEPIFFFPWHLIAKFEILSQSQIEAQGKLDKIAARHLGSIRTEKKAASSRENGRRGGRPRKYLNICERYGEGYKATLNDYRDLNPDGIFEVHGDGIREYFGNGSTWELIATR